jgi:hypothetical protein
MSEHIHSVGTWLLRDWVKCIGKEIVSGRPDYEKAKLWFERCSPTNLIAQRYLGILYLRGLEDTLIDKEKGLGHLCMAASHVYADGIAEYGLALEEDGRDAEALMWYLKGARDETLRDSEATGRCQYLAAMLYKRRLSNLRQAVFWATQAELHDHPAAKQLLTELEELMWAACGNCKKKSPKLRCGACQSVAYCNVNCQRAAWKQHKIDCKDVPEIKTRICPCCP